MVYSLFHCSLLLALFPFLGSSTTCSLPPSHALQALSIVALLRATTRSSLRCHTLLVTLSRSAGSFTTCSLMRHHSLLATLPCPAGSFKSRSLPHHHSLHATLSRSKIPLNTPCFVTRKTMAEGAKKHDDFRLPT